MDKTDGIVDGIDVEVVEVETRSVELGELVDTIGLADGMGRRGIGWYGTDPEAGNGSTDGEVVVGTEQDKLGVDAEQKFFEMPGHADEPGNDELD